MEEEPNSNQQQQPNPNTKTSKLSHMSLESMGSNFSAVMRDIEDNHPQNAQNEALRESLKYIMSIESSEKRSELFEKLINEDLDDGGKKKSVYGSAIQNKSGGRISTGGQNDHRNSANRGSFDPRVLATTMVTTDHSRGERGFNDVYGGEARRVGQSTISGGGGTTTTNSEVSSSANNNPYNYANQYRSNIFSSGNSIQPQSHPKNLPNSNISDESEKLLNSQLAKKYEITHTCLCTENECIGMECQCFTIDDHCIEVICCQKCVEYKRKKLRAKERLEQEGILRMENYKPCTCKKTKCNKKYCACFAAGIKCTNRCLCDDCENCDFYEVDDSNGSGLKGSGNRGGRYMKNEPFIDMEYEGRDMAERMDFDPVQFPDLE